MTDWEYVRRCGDYRKGRLATLRRDEEPDDDMLKAADLHYRAIMVESDRLSYRDRYKRRLTTEEVPKDL